jgi:hypothetical protein
MKRFRILENKIVIEKFNTLQMCVNWLKKQELGLHNYYVECVKDDIEVHADDIIDAFKDGERPMDLQFF